MNAITTKEITEQLEKGILNLYNSESYRSYLSAMSRFHHYSYRNSLLIWLQRPDASYVAGYRTWIKGFNRYVKKGEKGIRIFAPVTIKRKDNEEEEIIAYKTTTVFDISQTEGSDLPKGFTKQLLGDLENEEDYIYAFIEMSPVPIFFDDLKPGTNGYYSPNEKKIVINNNISSLQTIKTIVHELTHAMLHDPENIEYQKDRRTAEVEAESVAFTVLQHYGIDTSEYSFGYITDWSSSKDLKEFKSSLETIEHTSNLIIDKLDEILGHN